ncbi:hypothetical protein [Thermoanaerobacterium thermosulfurigenes]|uniref:hypothetical protein n=1 Tax=Thermoanaerobacterium thermosulfurigenes TaxID=33950 RepID=UPI003F49C7C4
MLLITTKTNKRRFIPAFKEIDEADLVIFAADVAVKEELRFKDKPIYKVEAQKAIKNAKAVVEDALKILQKWGG